MHLQKPKVSTSEPHSSHQFWVASSNFFETSIIFYPLPYRSNESGHDKDTFEAEGELYDCDGTLVNTLKYSFDVGKVTVLELSALMEGFKYESGLKHGIMVLKTGRNVGVQCRLHSHSAASFLGELKEVGKADRTFLPLRFSEGSKTLLSLVNLSKDLNQIKCKLFLGKRSPEISLSLPKQGVRLVSVNSEFTEAIESKHIMAAGYLRVSSKNDLPFAAQIVECLEGKANESVFSTIL